MIAAPNGIDVIPANAGNATQRSRNGHPGSEAERYWIRSLRWDDDRIAYL
jgi:hypothetical protein